MDLNAHVKSVIELKTCPIHYEYPTVEIIDNHLNILCCCTDFKIACLKTMVSMLTEEREQKLKVVWKGN
jgi:hypothetical protein